MKNTTSLKSAIPICILLLSCLALLAPNATAATSVTGNNVYYYVVTWHNSYGNNNPQSNVFAYLTDLNASNYSIPVTSSPYNIATVTSAVCKAQMTNNGLVCWSAWIGYNTFGNFINLNEATVNQASIEPSMGTLKVSSNQAENSPSISWSVLEN